jgi:hypothetical protein
MATLRRRTLHSAILSLALAGTIAGCSSDEDATGPTIDPAVLGTWDATSFDVAGTDLIAQGMTFSWFFGGDGGYTITVTGDLADICDTGTACSDFGDFTASATQIVLDPGTIDETFINYSISGTTMTTTVDINGTVATIVFASGTPSDPAVVGTWNATSFDAAGTDLIAMGMSFSFSFGSTISYSITIGNDQGGLCDVGTDCTVQGNYTATATQIFLDPGTTDETILNYSISGTTMTVNATIDATAVTVVLTKA